MEDEDDVPPADPRFAEHFSDPIYDDLGGEFTPFGSDEGYDMLYEWIERRAELGPSSTVMELLEGSGFGEAAEGLDAAEQPGVPGPSDAVDEAMIVIGAGFTLLRLTGQIDEPGRRLTLNALDALIAFYGPQAELARQRDDLVAWSG